MGTLISGTYSSPLFLSGSGANPATVTGTITVASGFALYGASGTDWTITNSGLLESDATSSAFGILLPGGGAVTNTSTGRILAGGTGGNAIQLATSVVNAGLISASGQGVFGASYVYNQGTILGGQGGANLTSGTLNNAGSIDAGGTYGVGVLLQGGGTVSNQSAGTITATGLGVNVSGGAGTVINSGLISGDAYGVVRAASVINHGIITGAKGGLNLDTASVLNDGSIGGTNSTSPGVLLQSGSLTNLSAGTITGGAIGVNVSAGAGTVENAGLISGSVDAVSFAGGFANRLIVDPGARFSGVVDGGASSTSTLELSAGVGTLAGLGSQYVNFAEVSLDSGAGWTLTGVNTIGSGVTLGGTGTLTIAAGATLEIAGTVVAGETIAFGGSGAALLLDSSASMAGSVTGFAPGEAIDLRGVDPASVSYAAGALDYTAPGGGSASFPLSVVTGGVIPSSDGASGTELGALCFCAGTLIRTPAGDVPVETLAVEDMVVTTSGTARPIRWIGVGRVMATRGRRSAATPVIVRKGALADNVPHHDLHVTKGHALALDGVLIPVEFLVNHRSIVWDDRAQEVALYHIELDRHDVLVANGAPAESYRDDGNRWLFQNANSGWDQPPKPPCAPVLTGGPVVDAVWRRLLERAGLRPGLPLTNDPDLHLLVDGVRLDALRRRDDAYVFRLPRRPAAVRLRSRAAVPQELGIARDARHLGVAVQRLELAEARWRRTLDADSASLAEGYHAFEACAGVRWTDGDAAVPAALFAGMDGPAMLVVRVGGATQYRDDGWAARATG